MNNQINPFNITKAFHFSDLEIEEYWTEFGKHDGFKSMIKPNDPMPIYILGGKGSGKTHIMRYFSYQVQRIRSKNNILPLLNEEKFIGIYSLCSGLNASRFTSKGISDTNWMKYFEYYFEIWIASLIIEILLDVTNKHLKFKDVEKDMCVNIENQFDQKLELNNYTFIELLDCLYQIQKEINIYVNNNRLDDILIKVSRGNLIFGIPEIISKKFSDLKNVQFLYLLDEFENFSEYQQKYVNTLVRERKNPVSFRIGSRLYGFKTNLTYSDNESIKIGSEYDELNLDLKLRSNEENYTKFAYDLCAKRLLLSGYIKEKPEANNLKNKLDNYFEEFDEEKFFRKISDRYSNELPPYFKKLSQILKDEIKKDTNEISEVIEELVDEVIRNLRVINNPLLEKINVFLFYKDWSKGEKNYIQISLDIMKECKDYLKKNTLSTKRYGQMLQHYKGDMIAQLLKDMGEKQKYTGLENFVKMSWGIPRNLLIILKEIFQWAAVFNNEEVFTSAKISIKSQENGVLNSSKWFLDDSKIGGTDGKNMIESLERLTLLFREIRFSDKPSECSVSSFSVNMQDLSDNSYYILELLSKYSLLINVNLRKNKNSKRMDNSYQINRILSPIWELPISRRGIISLNNNLANSIFDSTLSNNFDKNLNLLIKTMKAPFQKPKTQDRYNLPIDFPQ